MKKIAQIFIFFCMLLSSPLFAKELTESQKKIKEINALIRKDPYEAEYYYRLAKIYVNDKNYRSAEYEIKKAYKMHPKDKYRLLLGNIFLIQEKAEDVLALFPDNGLVNDNSYQKMLMVAKAYIIRESYDEALDTYKKILEMRPNDKEALMGEARVYVASKQPEKAKSFLIKLTDKYEEDKELWLLKADFYLSEEYYDHAIRYYKQIIEKHPKIYEAYLGYAKASMAKKDYKSVLENGQKMMQILPQKPMGRYYSAKASFELGDTNKAYYIYANIPTNHPDLSYPKAYFIRAEVQLALGRITNAQELFRHYLSLYPYDEKALEYIAQIKLQQESYHQAMRDYEVIYKKNPFNINAYNGMLSAFIQTENYEAIPAWIDKILGKFSLPAERTYAQTVAKFVCGYSLAVVNCKTAKSKDLATQMLKIIDAFYYGRQGKSMSMLDQFSKEMPKEADIWALKGMIEMRQHKEVLAYDVYTKALILESDNKQALEGMESLSYMPQMQKRVLDFLWSYYEKTKAGRLVGTWMKIAYTQKKYDLLKKRLEPLYEDKEIRSYDFWYIASKFIEDKSKKALFLEYAARDSEDALQMKSLLRSVPSSKVMRRVIKSYISSREEPDYDVLLQAALNDMDYKNYPDAEIYLNDAIKIKPKDHRAYDYMAQIMFQRGQIARLNQFLIKYSELFDYGKKTSLKAWLMVKQKSPKEAADYLVEQYGYTKNKEILLTLYEVKKQMTSEDSAVLFLETYNDALTYSKTAMMVADYYIRHKNYDKAERILRSVKQKRLNDPEFLSRYAMARYYIQESDGFLYAKKALEYDNSNQNYHRIYGITAEAYGGKDVEAFYSLVRAKQSFPDDELVKEAYDKVQSRLSKKKEEPKADKEKAVKEEKKK